MAAKIEKTTIIGDVLDIAPETAPLFMAIGMHCLGCPSSRGETVEEALRLSQLFIDMIKGKELTEQDKIDLDEAAQLQDISHMPARVKCAELAWRTLDGMLRENADAVPATTE